MYIRQEALITRIPTVGPNLVYTARSVNYTHPDGQSYTFTRAFQGGSGSETSRYISIVPEAAACTVTVVFDGHGNDGRVQYIYYNGEKLGETYSAGDVSAVTADITKATIEANPGVPIITYGGGSNKNVYAIFIEYYVETPNKFLSGNVENATGRDFTGKNMIFTNIDDPNETYTVEYGTSYNIELPKGKTFSVTIEGEPDVCTTTDSSEIEILHNRYDQTQNLRFVLIENMPVSGAVSTISSHDTRTPLYDYDSSIGATLVFTKQGETEPYAEAAVGEDGTYTATLISNETYDVTLKEGTGEGYTLSPLSTTYVFEAGDENPYKNILLMKDVEPEIAYDAELTVGPDKEYPSISEAIAAVRRMEKSRNDQTVTIVIDPGTYEEQLYVDENNIVLKAADPEDRPMIQWYYGIGYVYYSADPSGWYDADWAAQKTEQRTVSNWGATIRTYGAGFLAENLDVQNTFNKFIVQAELDDGVQPGGGDAKNYDRDSLDVEVKNKDKATERAAAIFAGGSEIELYRCSFSSSQDTFGTGATSMYVKECDISGNTDYICGGNNVYFENCNLIWTGYSDHSAGGYITASKTSNESGLVGSDLGYYFKDCTVKNSNESGMHFANGDWGRNWGGKNCQTIFDNTTIASGTGTPGKWGNMGGDPAKMSVLYVVNGVWAENDTGHTKDLTNSDDNPRGTVESNSYILPEATDFFGDWTPVHYVDDSSRLNIEAAPAENGSINFSVGGRLTTRAAKGEVVTIVPNPEPNYQLDTVSVKGAVSETDVEVTNNTFVMPDENVIVTATFKATEAQPTTDPATMVGDVEWYFGISNNSGKIDINGTKGQIGSRASASGDDGATKYLEIDATAEGARIDNKDNNDTTGYRRDEWAAITTGTKISIPVMQGSVVTVRGYGDGAEGGKNLAYTINGEAKEHVSQGDQTYVYTGEAGFIDLIVTYGRYISYIKVNTPKPLEGQYSDWNVGHANDSRDGELQTVTYEGQESLYIANRNAYKVIDEPISTGVATFEFDLYIDTAIDRNFRVYLENGVSDITNQDNVFAEVINNRGSGVNYGPGIDAQTTKLFTYDQLAGSGWVHFTITLDYNNAATDQFITVTATNEAGLNATQTMGAISGQDTTLRQIRLVATAQSPYFANMELTTE